MMTRRISSEEKLIERREIILDFTFLSVDLSEQILLQFVEYLLV
jgi:hypothetical protein